MQFSTGQAGRERQIIDLCASTFTASEGTEEGASIARLVTGLLGTTPDDDVVVCCAQEGPTLVGCIVFSRLRYEQDERIVFVLAPVAVRTDRQGEGIGQQLLTYGLKQLRGRGVDVVLTYGDPAYYSKVGFRQITEDVARAPLPLSFPHGWLGQSLTERDLQPLAGPGGCVPALDSPEYW
jgi:predicted N-acetyltransferase YhbS